MNKTYPPKGFANISRLRDITPMGDNHNVNLAGLILTLAWNDYGEAYQYETTKPCLCRFCGAEARALAVVVDALEEKGVEPRIGCCQACDDKYEREREIEYLRGEWEKICPKDFRETDLNHPEFNRRAWDQLKRWPGGESLYFHGRTRSCKTRIMMEVLKRRLLKGASVQVMWPWDLKEFKGFVRNRIDKLEQWAQYTYLGIDDAILTASSHDSLVDALLDLIDMRMQNQRHVIITSQIDLREWESDLAGMDISREQAKRIEALLARIREVCNGKKTSFSEDDAPKKDAVQEEVPF